jgi:N-dimethylarginine dimethylaminohydrolase
MKTRFLMCPPDYFGVEYSINPWMDGNLGLVDLDKAKTQWQSLFETLSELAEIELLDPQPHLPDLVFTANAGLAWENTFIPSHFQYSERRREETNFRNWFSKNGYHLADLPGTITFEGEGDALFQPNKNLLWIGYGFRTDLKSLDLIKNIFPLQVVSLQLTDPRFYHLDTCFCLLQEGQVLYYPGAFSKDSLQSIKEHFSAKDRIEIDEEDALHFACNSIVAGKNMISNHASANLVRKIQALGYRVILRPVGEFLKAGGGNKCLALSIPNN